VTELRRDIVRDSWVLISSGKALKPGDFPINKSKISALGSEETCPFCEGNEALTTPEIAAYRPNGSQANEPGWLIRTIPNKYAMFKMKQGDLDIQSSGIYNRCNGLGQHEVIIETPKHGLELHELPAAQMKLLFEMLQQRYRALALDSRIKYIQIYKNRGLFAGASQEHSHSQILAYPMVPDKNRGLRRYFKEHRDCLICQIINEEMHQQERIIYEGEHFILISPYAARFSYEAWIVPKQHREHFVDINKEELYELQIILQGYLETMLACLENPSYNIMINSAPVNIDRQGVYHWYMEITPRLLIANAVEISSGYFINPVAPEAAAEILRDSLNIR